MDISELLNIPVKEVMTTDLKVGSLDDTMESIESTLHEYNINHVPIVDDKGQLKGIVTRNDLELLKDWGTELGLTSAKKRNAQLLATQLASARMSEISVTVGPEDTLEHCAYLFRNNIFHALPVVENEILIGIVTTYDMLRIAYSETPITSDLN